ncbi:MAG TPA: hypothetical protein VF183_09430 [Acidimicrobiales bacterium]
MTEADAPPVRRVRLDDERELVVRAARPDDVDGLVAMYDELSDEDVYLRFFSPHRPGRELFERIATIDQRGGAALVAEVIDDKGATIVADAWYSMLPDGDGELAITVAAPWRGWLGSFLLDALLDVAAQRGVRNLQAEILLRNRPMMALVRRRGCVTLADDGPSVRVAIGSGGRPPTWAPAASHPRVLVEGRRGWRALAEAERVGLDVLVCPGPPADGNCPALSHERCPLAADADAVVISIPTNSERTRELLRAHRELHPTVPVFVEGPREDVEDVASDGAVPLPSTLSDAEIVQRLLRVLGEHPHRDDHHDARPDLVTAPSTGATS